jgi:hypothetical protein
MANAQKNDWPISMYGGDGAAYNTSPVINGYLVVNSKHLKGLIHRVYLKGTLLDTLINNDTLYGRIKLDVVRENLGGSGRWVDIELAKTNVVSVPTHYIKAIISISQKELNQCKPLTSWVILSSNRTCPFGRLIGQKNNVTLYDCSTKDTSDVEYRCPMTLRNGYEEIEISSPFLSTKKTLRKFIEKRYGVEFDLSNKNVDYVHFFVRYILEQENMTLQRTKNTSRSASTKR